MNEKFVCDIYLINLNKIDEILITLLTRVEKIVLLVWDLSVFYFYLVKISTTTIFSTLISNKLQNKNKMINSTSFTSSSGNKSKFKMICVLYAYLLSKRCHSLCCEIELLFTRYLMVLKMFSFSNHLNL